MPQFFDVTRFTAQKEDKLYAFLQCLRECIPLFSNDSQNEAARSNVPATQVADVEEIVFAEQKPAVMDNKWFSHPAGMYFNMYYVFTFAVTQVLNKFKNISFPLGMCNYINVLGTNNDVLKLLATESTGHFRPISADLVVLDLPYNISDRENDKAFDWASLKETLTILSQAIDITSCTYVFWHNYFHTGHLLAILEELHYSCIQPIAWVKPDSFAAVDCMFSAHETGMFVWPHAPHKMKAVHGKVQGLFVYVKIMNNVIR